MRELNLAAMALLIVIVAPMIIGWAWPSGTETVDTWTTEGNIDITPSIATADIPILDSYAGPMNHYWLYSNGFTEYEPVAYGSSPSAIPRLTYTATVDTVTTNPWTINLASYATDYRTDFITIADLAIDMEDGSSYTCSTAVYMPGANAVYMIGLGHHAEPLKASDIHRVSVQGASPSNPLLLTIRTYTQTGEYVDMSKGFVLDADLAPYYLDWFNGMSNHSVELWIRTASIAEASTITAGGLAVELDVVDGALTVNGETLGASAAYPYISLIFDHDEGTATVSGLIGASSFTDPTWTVGNAVTIDDEIALDSVRMSGSFEYEVKRTYSEIGTGKGIKDATIIPYDYYPHYSWQVSFDSPARFGDLIAIGGLPHTVEDGKIQIHDRNTGEAHDVPIRGMAILSLIYNDGEDDEPVQHLYVNGIEISTVAPEQGLAIILRGDWYVSVTVSDVSQGEQTGYTWDLGTFGLDKTGYCMVGLMSSIIIMIGAGLWGRASGTKLMVVMIAMGICAASYFLMM